MLFCLTIHPMLKYLKSELRAFYLNDGTLGGTSSDIIQDLESIENIGRAMGLQLNRSKTQLISKDGQSQERILDVFSDLSTEDSNGAQILGSPIGDISKVSKALQGKSNLLAIELLSERVHDLPAHEGFFLFKHSLAIPKILFLLWTAPCYLSSQLLVYDNLLRRLLSDITNVHLEQDTTWLQAALPTSNGGTGTCKAAQLAPSAFLAGLGCGMFRPCLLHSANRLPPNFI